MKDETYNFIPNIDTKGWKKILVEYGKDSIEVLVPKNCVELAMSDLPVLPHLQRAIEEALENPIKSPTIEEIIKKKSKPPEKMSVSIAVSDITRPVPYKGDDGILLPILRRLQSSGIKRENIKIIVATGMHRATTEEEKVRMYGKEVVEQYKIIDHDCENKAILEDIGNTRRGTHVFVNQDFYLADLKIATGLVESHFMAGISGGRKSICPGLVDLKTIQKFHGPDYLENPNATNLVLKGNPCHEEALEVAQKVGVDFVVNLNLDRNLRLIGIFAGDMVEANLKAYELLKTYAEIPFNETFDIILTHSGYVGKDHYQTAKAGVGALPAVKEDGTIIIVANNWDSVDPIGSSEYKTLMHLLKLQGPDGYLNILKMPDWKFIKDQWEPEMWGKVLRKVGEKGLIYCSLEIDPKDYDLLPGISGLNFLKVKSIKSSLKKAREMVQGAIKFAISRYLKKGIKPTMAFIREGPYAVPKGGKSESSEKVLEGLGR